MPQLPLPQIIVLVLIVAAFTLFGVVLFAVSVYAGARPDDEAAQPIEREVIPAKRAP